jgi:ribosomal protein S18 acetylase RimI-like enzyme
MGEVTITVDPYRRRQGIGRQLFAAGVDRIRAADRKVLLASSLDEPVGVAFARAMGLARAIAGRSAPARPVRAGLDTA